MRRCAGARKKTYFGVRHCHPGRLFLSYFAENARPLPGRFISFHRFLLSEFSAHEQYFRGHLPNDHLDLDRMHGLRLRARRLHRCRYAREVDENTRQHHVALHDCRVGKQPRRLAGRRFDPSGVPACHRPVRAPFALRLVLQRSPPHAARPALALPVHGHLHQYRLHRPSHYLVHVWRRDHPVRKHLRHGSGVLHVQRRVRDPRRQKDRLRPRDGPQRSFWESRFPTSWPARWEP